MMTWLLIWIMYLNHLVVIIRGMTPGLWAIDLDHLVVIMMPQLLTDPRHWPWAWAIDLDDLVVIMMTRLLTWII